jgi:hypothetical protein
MLQLLVILTVYFILVPLIDLCLNERVRIPVKICVYLATFIWLIVTLFFHRGTL